MLKGPFEVEIRFGSGGNGESFASSGWSLPEPEYTFNRGHEAILRVPKPYDADRYELRMDIWPYLVESRLPVQRLAVLVRGLEVLRAEISDRERQVITCEIPPHVVAGCDCFDITLRFPDAVAPVSVSEDSLDERVIAFAFFGVAVSAQVAGAEDAFTVVTAMRADIADVTTIYSSSSIDYQESTTGIPAWDQERLNFVDVGAMGGIQPKWQPYLDQIAVVLFEPNPEEAAKLRHQHPEMTVVESALSSINSTRKLHITENPTCISLRAPNQEFLASYSIHPHLRVIGSQEVICARYDNLHERGTVPIPDAIKLDVQGCEFEVLLGFGALLQNCLGIELESQFYPVYTEQKLLQDIVELLREYGFVLRKLEQNKMGNFEGDLVEVDAFFTKPRAVVASYNGTQRRKFDLLTEVWGLAPYRL